MGSILPIDFDQVGPVIGVWLFTSVRISSFFMVTPFFSQLNIPPAFKIFLTLAFAFVFASVLNQPHLTSDTIFSGWGVLCLLHEVVVGLAMGYILKITFEVLTLCGEMVSNSMQLNFAEMYSPSDHNQTNVLGGFYQIFGMLIFISLHGPLLLVTLLYKSFLAMPIYHFSLNRDQLQMILTFSQYMFFYSLLMALPVMATLLIVNVGMAVISRMAVTFNIFTVGFPIVLLIGIFTLIYSMPFSLANFHHVIEHTLRFTLRWAMAR